MILSIVIQRSTVEECACNDLSKKVAIHVGDR